MQALCVFSALEVPGFLAVICGAAEGEGRTTVAAGEKAQEPMCASGCYACAGARTVKGTEAFLVILKKGGQAFSDFMCALKVIPIPTYGPGVEGVLENAAYGAAVKGAVPFGADLSCV